MNEITKIKNGRVTKNGGVIDTAVYFDRDKIVAVTNEELPFDCEIDARGNYVVPGFIDIHVHGGAGCDFTEGCAEDIVTAANFHLLRGTTSIFPTVTASDTETMKRALRTISEAATRTELIGEIIGAHLEGPYFSLKQSGAQNPAYITAPVESDYKDLIGKYGKTIKRWSYAPERDTGAKFCRYLVEHNIVPSAGHTDALFSDMEIAAAAGCRLITHLYSCTSTVTRENGFRRGGVLEAAYLSDDIWVEIIADGKHLPPELIRLVYKIKGEDRIILVTDALRAAGTRLHEASIGGIRCIIEDGVCKLPDRSAFAGSVATADTLVRVCVKDAGIPLPSAVKMITENPAKLFGLNKGLIDAGYDPDIVIFDDDIRMKYVIKKGAVVSAEAEKQ